MPVVITERRRRARITRGGVIRILVPAAGARPVAEFSARLVDVSEFGCGIETAPRLEPRAAIQLVGSLCALEAGLEMQARAQVSWSRLAGLRRYRSGISFLEVPEAIRSFENESVVDHYETLELAATARPETIHRIYRLLAKRYHPDTKRTGDEAAFRKVLQAYEVLGDPQRRAAYDVVWQRDRGRRGATVDPRVVAHGSAAEKARRRTILELLYVKRMHSPETGNASIAELENLVGVPRERLEFTLWYLREKGLVLRGDTGRFSITARGVDWVDDAPQLPAHDTHLLEAALA